MPHASFVQTSFLGGEWSQLVQGRMDVQSYKTGLNILTNAYPIEEGAAVFRQGTRYLSHTRHGSPGKLIGFDFAIDEPYQMEFTDAKLRFWRGTSLIYDYQIPIADILPTNPATVVLGDTIPASWANGDTVFLVIDRATCVAPLLCYRQFTITKTSSNTFTIADAITGAPIDGATLGYVPSVTEVDTANHIFELTTVYTGTTWSDLRNVQDNREVFLLRSGTKPYVVSEGTTTLFQINAADFLDGPYLDVDTSGATVTPGATTGSTTFTWSSITSVNGGAGFATATDVGRIFRLRGGPAAWNSGTTYATGNTVTGSDGNAYVSLKDGNLNHNPTVDVTFWSLSPLGPTWTWAQITAVSAPNVVTATIRGQDLPNTNAITTWRLGVFSLGTGFPTCGALHEGRLFLSGVVPNRVDGSKSGDHLNFAPSSVDGTVADDNAVAAVFDAKELNDIFWLITQEDGLYAGSASGEWRIRASTLDDPITPTSIQVRRVTTFGCYNAEVMSTPKAMLFIQRKQRKVFEFSNFGQNTPDATNLTLTGGQMTKGGLLELAWMQEPTPILWGRRTDGALVGCSYKRDPDKFYAGWHKHVLGGNRFTNSISTGPTFDGRSESLYLITNEEGDPDDGVHWVEMLTGLFDDDKDDWEAWFLDGAVSPCCVTVTATDATFYGLWHLNGQTVCTFIAGLDVGEWLVANGSITVPLGTPSQFTADFLAAVTASGIDYGAFAVHMDGGTNVTTVIPPTHTNSLTAYVEVSGSVVGVTGTAALLDETNQVIFDFNNGNGATDGLRKFGTGGNEVAVANLAALGITELDDNTGGSAHFAMDNYLYFTTAFANTSTITKFSETLVNTASTGVSSAATTGPGPFAVYSMCSTQLIGADGIAYTFLVSSTTLNNHVITILGAHPTFDFLTDTGFPLTMPFGRPAVCRGVSKIGYCSAYVLEKPLYGAPAATAHILHEITIGDGAQNGDVGTPNTHLNIRTIGTISPPTIDAQWTNFSDAKGLAYDQTDGHVLAMFATTDVGATIKRYLVKLSTIDASVIWKTQIANLDAFGDQNMNKHQITTQRFMYWDGSSGPYVFDTSTGAKTAMSVYTNGFTLTGGQISNDSKIPDGSGSLTIFGSYSGAAPIPTFLGPYSGPTVTNQWMRLAAGLTQFDTTQTVYATPAIIGRCYTEQVQLLRPDAGNDAGAANGPAFGKKRRIHWFSAAFLRTLNVSIGTNFITLKPVKFKTPGGTNYTQPTLFSGEVSDTIDNDYQFTSQIAFEHTGPFPCNILAVGGYIEAFDK